MQQTNNAAIATDGAQSKNEDGDEQESDELQNEEILNELLDK